MSGLGGWLHCKGYARILNTGSRSDSDRGTAYIQGVGPRWLATRLALYALRSTPLARPDWQTVRIEKTEQPARYRWRFQLAFRRLPR